MANTRSLCRWVDIIGRNPRQLERVRQRLAMPSRLVALSLSEHLQPAMIRVPPARFLVTYFTSPSRTHVFARHPVFLWLDEQSIVTISPWARKRGVLGTTRSIDATRDDLLCRVLEGAIASHEEVGRQLNDAFFGRGRSDGAYAWHRKEGRLARFVDLLDAQLRLVNAVATQHRGIPAVRDQLRGLLQIAHSADRKLRASGACRLCRRHAPRRGIVERVPRTR